MIRSALCLWGALLAIDLSCAERPVLQWHYTLQGGIGDPLYRVRLSMIDEAHEAGEAIFDEALPEFPRSLVSIVLEYAVEDDVMPYLSFSANAVQKIVGLYPLQGSSPTKGFMLRVMCKRPKGLQKLYSCNIEDNTIRQLCDSDSYEYCDKILGEQKCAMAVAFGNIQTQKFLDCSGDFLIDLTAEGCLRLFCASGKYIQLSEGNTHYQKLHYAGFYQHKDSNCAVIVVGCQAPEAEPIKNVLLRYSFCKDSSKLLKKCSLPGSFCAGLSDIWGNLAYMERNNDAEQPLIFSSHGSNIFRIPESWGVLQGMIGSFWYFQKINDHVIESEKNIIYTGGDSSISWQFATDPTSISQRPPVEVGLSSPRVVKPSLRLALARRQKWWALQDMGISALVLGASVYSTGRAYVDQSITAPLEMAMVGICSFVYGYYFYKKKPKQVQSSL